MAKYLRKSQNGQQKAKDTKEPRKRKQHKTKERKKNSTQQRQYGSKRRGNKSAWTNKT